jgi:GNAT superfamily N-acetyltransferase
MLDPTDDPSPFHLRKASMDDFSFAEALTRSNMGGYYRRHHLVWRSDLFLASWRESENFILEADGERIGVLRITEEGDSLHIRDVQIAEGHRRRGAGTYLLNTSRSLRTATARIRRQSCGTSLSTDGLPALRPATRTARFDPAYGPARLRTLRTHRLRVPVRGGSPFHQL